MTESLLVIRGFIWSAKGFIAHEQINHSLHVPVDVIKLHRIVCSDHSGLGHLLLPRQRNYILISRLETHTTHWNGDFDAVITLTPNSIDLAK